MPLSVITANRLTDGVVVWRAGRSVGAALAALLGARLMRPRG